MKILYKIRLLPRVPFVNCRQFMYLVISLLVLKAGCGIWLYQFLIIAYLFTFQRDFLKQMSKWPKQQEVSVDIKICPLWLSAPDLQLYTFVKSWKDVYKVRLKRFFLNLQQTTRVIRPSFCHKKFGLNELSAPAQGLCLNFFSLITADFNISSALRWTIQDQWSSVFFYCRCLSNFGCYGNYKFLKTYYRKKWKLAFIAISLQIVWRKLFGNVCWVVLRQTYSFYPNLSIWLVAMTTSEALWGIKLKYCRNVHSINLYNTIVFYCCCVCTLVAIAT